MFTCIATLVLRVDIPQTRGYFNVGDSAVYITALLFGPIVGSVAGGLGPMIADIVLGAPWFAPGTLIIKVTEGFLVGYTSHKPNLMEKSKRTWKSLTIFLGISLAFVIYEFGSVFYIGEWRVVPLGLYMGSI